MSFVLEETMKRIQQIEKEIVELNRRLEDAPEGRLRISKTKYGPRYYQVTEKGNYSGVYITKDESGIANALAQKDYNEKMLMALHAELNILKEVLLYYELNNGNSKGQHHKNQPHLFYGPEELLWRQLSEERQKLVQPFLEDDAAFVGRWLSETYERPGFGSNDPDFYTEAGIRVRSKSEIQIGNKLDWRHLPHYIEKPVDLKGFHVVYPDFTILNVRTRKTYIWEHFGKMSDPEYVADNMEKLYWYGKNGYIPGKNMILTFETKEHSLDSTMIDNMIKTFLI